MTTHRVLHEPLLHFVALGALLFGAYGWLNADAFAAPDEIVVDAGRVASLEAQFERLWRRPPTAAERDRVIQSFVREEILYREGLARGLDRDDPIVRRRIGQKMEFLADETTPPAPTDTDLQAWLDAHAADYAVESRLSLHQVYFDPARRGAALDTDLAQAKSALAGGKLESSRLGDVTMLPPAQTHVRISEVEDVFGREFARAAAAVAVGAWQGPVRSSYGVHLVRVDAREDARTPTLAEVRAAVERDWLRKRSEQNEQAFYQALRARYTVRVETGATPSADARVAAKTP
jgi:hypothetical protein